MGRRKRKGVQLEVVGYRPVEGKAIVVNVFRVCETYGIPLDVVLLHIEQHGGMVSWIDYYAEAESAGMKHGRILSKLSEAIVDVWGKDFRDVVIARLERVGECNTIPKSGT